MLLVFKTWEEEGQGVRGDTKWCQTHILLILMPACSCLNLNPIIGGIYTQLFCGPYCKSTSVHHAWPFSSSTRHLICCNNRHCWWYENLALIGRTMPLRILKYFKVYGGVSELIFIGIINLFTLFHKKWTVQNDWTHRN